MPRLRAFTHGEQAIIKSLTFRAAKHSHHIPCPTRKRPRRPPPSAAPPRTGDATLLA